MNQHTLQKLYHRYVELYGNPENDTSPNQAPRDHQP
jgi:hypothetical protein